MPEFLQQKKMPESIFFKAENGTRTHAPFITSEVLYQLSYFSTQPKLQSQHLLL